jgi:N utilization substance protein A
MIQKIREAERDSLFDEYSAEAGQLVTGTVQRYEGGTATVQLTNTEAILPRSEQIPGESHHVGERVRATIFEVRKAGSRVKIILSRIRTDLVQRMFEQEIPEIADGVIEIRAMAREPGYRTKVAVSSTDQRVDCVGACVGVRGNRIKNIVDELAGERIDIVRWSDDMQVLIPNALQPAEVDEVILCPMLGRAIVLVREDQLSLAIGRRGQNVRLGSKLCGWDIEIMTREELDESIERAVASFSAMEGIAPEVAEALVGEGFLSYDDLSIIETDQLMEMSGLSEEQVEVVRQQAEVKAAEAERLAAEQRRRDREQAAEEGRKVAELHAAQSAAAESTPAESAATESAAAESTVAAADGTAAPSSAAGGDAAADASAAAGTNGSAEPASHEPTERGKSRAGALATGSPGAAADTVSEEGPSGETS